MPTVSNLRLCAVLVTAWIFSFSASAAFWSTNGPVNTPRYSHTATLMNDGRVLITGGANYITYYASTEIYDPFTGICSPGPNMSTNRTGHTATLLPNGKVLVAGGNLPAGFVTYNWATAELFDPATKTWTPTGSLNIARAGHTATLLPNGKVLVAGGSAVDNNTLSSTNMSSAEIYDPATGLWTQVNPMSTPRGAHTATLLRSGKVLVTGGYNTNTLASAELFDPATGNWTTAGTIPGARGSHSAVLLPNGKVLVAGGANGDSIATAALYDPVTNSWAAANPMTYKRQSFALNLLPNGKVLACCGWYQLSVYTNSEIFDPGTGLWSATASMNVKRFGATATVLANGRVLLAAGADASGFDTVAVASTEVYDSSISSFSTTSPMLTPRWSHTATLLGTGKVLIAGGYVNSGNNYTNGAELFDPATGNYTPTGSMLDYHTAHTATLLANGKVLVIDHGTNTTSAELYDPTTGTWAAAGPTPLLFPNHAAALLNDGRVLVMGGVGGSNTVTNCYLFNPTTSTWTNTGAMVYPTASATAVVLTNGNVLAAGGFLAASGISITSQNLSEIYDVQSGTWSTNFPMHIGRYGHTANLLPNGKVLVAGPDNTAEIFNPTIGTWTNTGSMNTNRQFHTSALLQNGQVLVIGGQVGTGGGFFSYPIDDNTTELYDPTTGTWRLASSLSYYANGAAATLLPTGKILVNGGNTNSGFTLGVATVSQLFDPGLGFAATNQPQLTTTPSNTTPGAALTINGTGFRGITEASAGNTGSSPSDHPVIQLRSIETTRTVSLNATAWSTNTCTFTAPTNFPQGPAMLTLFVNGIYSTSALINYTTATAVPFALLNPVKLPDGTFRFTFTNRPGLTFSTFATTNVGTPSTNWQNLGTPTETTSGQYQFTDPGAPTNRQRFYRVQSN